MGGIIEGINVALTRKDTRLKKIVVSAKMLQNPYHVRYSQNVVRDTGVEGYLTPT